MENVCSQYFTYLLSILHEAETKQRKLYHDAIDIEDFAESTAVANDARTKIQQLRKWIEELQRINIEVESFFIENSVFGKSQDELDDSTSPQMQNSIKEDTSLLNDNNVEMVQSIYNDIDVMNTVENVILNKNIENISTEADTSIIPNHFDFLGKRYSVDGWQGIFIKLCELMILKRPYIMANLKANVQKEFQNSPILSLEEGQIKSYKKLSNGFYADIGGSDSDLKKRCEYILSACGYSSDELQIRFTLL